MPGKASRNEVVAAIAYWEGQQNPSLCPSETPVVVELRHADLYVVWPTEVGAGITIIVFNDTLQQTRVKVK